jgi:LysW-gamma-L-lysine/LysW-L-ornithine aminotransferase
LEDYLKMQEEFIAPTYGLRGLTINKGEGVFLYDTNKKRYFDCFSNYGVNVLGHNIPEINSVILEQLQKITNLHGSFVNEKRSLFAKRLCELSKMDKVFFCNSGSEANEAAIKFARLATARKEILSAKMGYHGKTLGSLSITRTLPKYNEPFLPLLEHTKAFSYDDPESLREVISEETAAVFLEPIQGEGGIRIPNQEYFKEVKKICEEKGALLVIDEIQTGMGRTGKLLAIEHFGISPDIICMAKGLAGGMPVGAVLIKNHISEKLFSGCHTNTFGGNPLVCTAGLATLDYIEKNNLLMNAKETGNYFVSRLKKINSPIIREIRGYGLMIAIDLKVKCTEYTRKLQDNGIIVIPTGSTVLRLLPPIIFSKENVDEVMPIFERCLSS